jgi:DNA-binding transcriptional ArsR family regulator
VEFKVTLDREAFKVLASDTRLDILKALDERGMTVSELGRRLDLNKATVFEHLEKLVAAGLVKKLDEDRKWVYYQLSWKARRILHPERVTIALLFSSALGALLSGMVVAAEYLRQAGRAAGQLAAPTAPAQPTGGTEGGQSAGAASPAMDKAAERAPEAAAAAAGDPALLLAAIALLALVAVLAAIGLWTWRQARRRDAAERASA